MFALFVLQLLSLHSEDLGYLKVSLYCAFWMINKTGLTLEYKVQWFLGNHLTPVHAWYCILQEGSKVTKHPHTQDTVLLSTTNKKSKVSQA